ncbi:MAG: Asp/Glu/hydantoin racemase [Rhodovarius sp.]|nr:Asp/Glu/hydantoin racemase [Rhodovarius sp.]MCX7932204.1 Asp/Glu/hydantoin racemase [Rhodovarius sp.]
MRDATAGIRRIGMLLPSSNSVAEPLTQEMLRDVPGVTLHIARFRVTRLDTSAEALAQFRLEPLLAAADLLRDAHVHAICLNATAACYTGMAHDRALTAALGPDSDTAMLALLDQLRARRARRIGLLTPFLDEVQEATIRTLGEEGFTVAAEHHFNDPGNFSFGRIPEEAIEEALRQLARHPGLDAIAVISTGLRGPRPAARVEAETGIPCLDTIATALWGALRRAGVDPALVRGWGSVFTQRP